MSAQMTFGSLVQYWVTSFFYVSHNIYMDWQTVMII